MDSPEKPSPLEIQQAQEALRAALARTENWDEPCEITAQRLAELMVEADMPKDAVRKMLAELGLSRQATQALLEQAKNAHLKRLRDAQEREFADSTPVCPHCLKPIAEDSHFCPHCVGPITAHASIDPMGQVYSQGRAFQQAVSRKPRAVVVIAMWLIFGPSLIGLFFVAILSLEAMGIMETPGRYVISMGPVLDMLRLVVILGLITLNAAVLWKVTARWLRAEPEPAPDEEPEAQAE